MTERIFKIMCQEAGCCNFVNLIDQVSNSAKFVCRDHTKKEDSKAHFQDYQFDPDLGLGADPKAYERGQSFRFNSQRGDKINPFDKTGRRKKKKRKYLRSTVGVGQTGSIKGLLVDAVKEVLTGHENEQEILNLLTKDTRDSNS